MLLGTPGWIRLCPYHDGICARIWENALHESVIKPYRALSCRYPVSRAAVRLRRHGHVADRRLFRDASQRHGRRAEAGGKAT